MKINFRPSSGKERGASAVELAIILPILLVLLSAPVFFAIFFWHYTVAQKAAQNAVRYVSTVSEQEMRVPNLTAAVVGMATQIAKDGTNELVFASRAPRIRVFCGEFALCEGVEGGRLPELVTVTVDFAIKDTFFGLVNTGRFGWEVRVQASAAYSGN